MNREIIQQLLGEMQEIFAESFEEVIKAKNYAEFNKSYASKTIYKDKGGCAVCLLDDYVGLKPKERMMDDARERILEDVIDNSYRKAGIVALILDSVHKQTVKNLIMETEIPKTINTSKEKKEKYNNR